MGEDRTVEVFAINEISKKKTHFPNFNDLETMPLQDCPLWINIPSADVLDLRKLLHPLLPLSLSLRSL